MGEHEQTEAISSPPAVQPPTVALPAAGPTAGGSAARVAARIVAGDPPPDLVVATRALIGNAAVSRILARQSAPQTTAPHSAELEALATEIESATAQAEDLGSQIGALPVQTRTDPDQAERAAEARKTLETQLNTAEEQLEALLTRRVALFDEDIAYLVHQAGGDRSDPSASSDELTRLREQREVADEALRVVKRRRARRRIDELTRTASSDPNVQEELNRLGRFLASSARRRAAPGTVGKDSKGRGYVVYADHVKVGGGLPWRNNNPGNVNGKNITEGVIGWNPEGIGFHIFATPEDGAKASHGWWEKHKGMTVEKAIFAYSQGLRSEDPVKAAKQDAAAKEYTEQVEEWAGVSRNDVVGALSTDKFNALVQAVGKKEGAGGVLNQGETITCGPGTPAEYRELLGCDE